MKKLFLVLVMSISMFSLFAQVEYKINEISIENINNLLKVGDFMIHFPNGIGSSGTSEASLLRLNTNETADSEGSFLTTPPTDDPSTYIMIEKIGSLTFDNSIRQFTNFKDKNMLFLTFILYK